jgi:UPF0755 protein
MRLSVLSVLRGVFFLVFLIALGTGGYIAYKRLPLVLDELMGKPGATPVESGQKVIVAVPKGASLSQVAGVLKEKGVVSSAFVFKLVAMIRGEQRKIQAGEYELKTGSDAGDVLDLLISGKTLMFSYTAPEGYDTFQMAELFQQWGIMQSDQFLRLVKDRSFLKELGVESDSLEGYLFPDTYFLTYSEKADGKALIRKMVKRFQDVYDKHVKAGAEKLGWRCHQITTLASLIEKESGPSEHGLVSAVFHNRLGKKMLLQCDPTVIYGIKPMGSKITREDLNRKHPYNTYQRPGLPPGPIANPGKESLIAAANPAPDTEVLYFVAKNDGTHEFSSTLKDHNKWVNLYQKRSETSSQ